MGMTTAMVSMNAVVSHCAVAAPTENSSISSGSATDMMVSFRMTTNAAATSRPISLPVPAGRSSGCEPCPLGVRSAVGRSVSGAEVTAVPFGRRVR